jgi:RNA polymerase sigma factor (sigma-70 family)
MQPPPMADDTTDARNRRHPAIPGGPESTFHLLERVRAGDEAALDALFARYLVPLRRWASGRLPRWARDVSDTQDLVQETLINTFKRIEAFDSRGEGALQAYLRQALMNRIRDELRRFDRRGQAGGALDSQMAAAGPSPLEQAIGRQATDRYERALERLNPGDREAIIARVELGCTYDELAEALGKPSAEAARKTATRALIRLAAEMKRAE